MKRISKGSILEIHVHDEYYVYAQALQKDNIAYFDARYSFPVQNISNIQCIIRNYFLPLCSET